MAWLIWGQLNKTTASCPRAERGGDKYSLFSSSVSKLSWLSINRLCLVSCTRSPPVLPVKSWPFPHSSSLTPTQDLSYRCCHDCTNTETEGWDAQWDEANGSSASHQESTVESPLVMDRTPQRFWNSCFASLATSLRHGPVLWMKLGEMLPMA